MIPLPLLPEGERRDVNPVPVAPLVATLSREAETVFQHVEGGQIAGASLTYADLNAFTWYVPGKETPLPGTPGKAWQFWNSRRFGRRGLSRNTDTNRRQK